jgi:hypothetical protein
VPEISHHCPGVPFVLVGNKIDLRDDRETIQRLSDRGLRPISTEQGEELARRIGAVRYVECSALTQQGLKNVFDEGVRAALSPRPSTHGGSRTTSSRQSLSSLRRSVTRLGSVCHTLFAFLFFFFFFFLTHFTELQGHAAGGRSPAGGPGR